MEPKYWGVSVYGAAIWFHFWKYVVRIGNPFGRYRYAWRPLLSAWRHWR